MITEEGATGISFDLMLPIGTSYFSFPVKVDRTIADILPGVDVYRMEGNDWVLANNEKPQPFAVYRADLDNAVFVHLIGDKFNRSTFTIVPNVSTYMSIPKVEPVNAYDLFGTALVSIKEIRTNGLPMTIEDGIMKPGKVYLVVVSEPVTITLP